MKMPATFIQRSKYINTVVETPKGSDAKYNFDEETESFKLKKTLPEGFAFPFHFGFIPSSLGDDGDPLDVLVLMDEISWPGCIIECRVIGVIQANQTLNKKNQRNDRFVAVPLVSKQFKNIHSIFKLDKIQRREIEFFLESYTKFEKKKFKILGTKGPAYAVKLIKNKAK